MVEVLKNGQFGYSATTELNISGIQKALDKARRRVERERKAKIREEKKAQVASL